MALIVTGPQRGAIAFDPAQTGDALLKSALERIPENERTDAMAYTAAVESTESALNALV